MARTGNGDYAYDSSGNALLDFFSKAGSLFKGKGAFYGNETTAVELFKSAWVTDNHKSMKLAMWCRDCRGGAGNRGGFRDIVAWIAKRDPDWIKANMHLIPLVGRWDDLRALEDTPCEKDALDFWVRAIQEGNGLAAKWAPRAGNNKKKTENKVLFNKLRKTASLSPKDFRKLLSKNTNVVENIMCQNEWQDVEYNKVPSVAMARYNNAFRKHDPARFEGWKDKVINGEDGAKINASVLFPHDVLRTLYADLSDSEGGYYGWTGYSRRGDANFKDSKIANAQFEALPNYMEGTDERIMPICDFSASMNTPVSGSIQAMDVSMGLGLYCSDRVGEDNPFYRKFIPFSSTSKLVDWSKDTFSIAAQKHNDGWIGSTNIRSALDKIVESAIMFKATDEQMPTCLLILSDMQFDQGTSDDETTVEAGLKKWDEAGYNRPRIVYWNLAENRNSPATDKHEDVGLVSGFSPSLLKAILGGTDFSPMAILERAIEKYEVVDPTK